MLARFALIGCVLPPSLGLIGFAAVQLGHVSAGVALGLVTLLSSCAMATGLVAAASSASRLLGEGGISEGKSHAMDYLNRLEFALDATGTGTWTYLPATREIDWDARMRRVWGGDQPGSLPLATFLSSIEPADLSTVADYFEQPAADREIEFRIRRFDDSSQRWIAMRGHATSSATGEVVGTVRDVTPVHRHDEQVHLLMREVTHRSKNLLAIVQAMARQTVTDSLSAADFEQRFSSRLRGLSFSHEILAARDWRGAPMLELARGHLAPALEQHPDRITIAGPVVTLKPEAAQNLGLALNELTSNALRYGALSGETGGIAVEWFMDREQDPPRWMNVVWNEEGGRSVQPPARRGFGYKVMERIVARALDGSVAMTFAPTGLRWALRIPASYVLDDEVPVVERGGALPGRI